MPHTKQNIYILHYDKKYIFVFLCLPPEQKHLEAVLEKDERVELVNGNEQTIQVPTISSKTQTVLKSLFMVLGFLFRQNCRSLFLL